LKFADVPDLKSGDTGSQISYDGMMLWDINVGGASRRSCWSAASSKKLIRGGHSVVVFARRSVKA
jgi:hypothetical protein